MRALVVTLALLVAGLSWSRVVGFHAVTGPHQVAWRDASDAPFKNRVAHGIGASFVLDGRLIVSTDGDGPNDTGYAFVDPARGEAKVAWPAPEAAHPFMPIGIATRAPGTFAVALLLQEGSSHAYLVGIAGPDGWLRAPSPVLTWSAPVSGNFGMPLLLGMDFRGGDLELVVTHPGGDDSYGGYHAPDVVRVPVAGAPTITSHPFRCDGCNVVGALPEESGWKLVAQAGRTALVVDPSGESTPTPEALAWWAEFGAASDSDRAALGTLWGRMSPTRVVAKDGSRAPSEATPFPDFEPLHVKRFELVDGAVRSQALWSSSHDEFRTLAQRAGGRSFVTSSSPDGEEQLVGDDPSHLHPALRGTNTYAFREGHFLPKGDGLLWVAEDGAYVTLDENLQRVDPLSITAHLRTRGSGGNFLDEPRHVWFFGWALFGLPVMLVVGLLLARTRQRKNPFAGPLAAYVVTGGSALALVWPLL